MQLDVEAVRTLMAVLDHGSITTAARTLHVTRSAASWRIKRLEEHVGQDLLVRDGHDLRPTRAARLVLDDARSLVETHDRIARRLEGADLTGTVTVAGDTDTDVATLTRILGSFRRIHPGVEIDLTIDQAPRIRRGLAEGRIDIGLVEGTDEDLLPTDRVLATDDLVWVTGTCCPHDDGLIPLVTFGAECFYRCIGEPMLEAAGIDFRVALSVPSSAGVVASVADGLGVALLRRSWMTDRLTRWLPADDLPALPRVHHFARSSDHESDLVARLVEVIADEMGTATAALPTAS
ncbi:MAG: LysR family transcriptional regulator [Actinomycetota bacterium]